MSGLSKFDKEPVRRFFTLRGYRVADDDIFSEGYGLSLLSPKSNEWILWIGYWRSEKVENMHDSNRVVAIQVTKTGKRSNLSMLIGNALKFEQANYPQGDMVWHVFKIPDNISTMLICHALNSLVQHMKDV